MWQAARNKATADGARDWKITFSQEGVSQEASPLYKEINENQSIERTIFQVERVVS